MRRAIPAILGLAVAAAAAFLASGHLPLLAGRAERAREASAGPAAPAVTVVRVALADFHETVLVTGTLVPREEILVAPEVEGLRVLDLAVDIGDRVARGDVLARLVRETLDAQLAQNDAGLARVAAQAARAESEIVAAEARLEEAKAQFERAKPLAKSGYMSESVFDQREAAARTASAQLAAARDGLKVAAAEKAQLEAQRRELEWRLAKAEVRAPAGGIVSRRNARIGGLATGIGEPMFRIIRDSEIELDAELTETSLAKVREGQRAIVSVTGASEREGTVRLVSPEVDRATRLGRVRVFLGADPALRIGSFARGTIATAEGRGLAVPVSAVQYGPAGASVLVVVDGKVATRAITTGLSAAGSVEVRSGLVEGDVVVARAGTFLRDGDTVRPVLPDAKVSEAGR
ncbi:MAG: efflux RND transporter periplasmic adaptor subunit [Pseudomonadota bacterium]